MGLTVTHTTADETGKTNATLVDTGLSFAVTNGVYYRFRFYVLYRSSATPIGLKLGLTTPTFTRYAATQRISQGSASATAEYQGGLSASGNSYITANVNAINTDYIAVIEGDILPSADGTLMVQYAAETTGATVTMRQGSAGELVDNIVAASFLPYVSPYVQLFPQ